jgi:hypothetical protein|eukprot:1043247-Prymnesium_polylepis.2
MDISLGNDEHLPVSIAAIQRACAHVRVKVSTLRACGKESLHRWEREHVKPVASPARHESRL